MLNSTFWKKSNSNKWLGTIFRFIVQNTGKRCVILLVFFILRWSFNYESNVFRYNKILIDCVFGNTKFVVPSTLTIDLGFASVNSQRLGDNRPAIPSYPVNTYILFHKDWKKTKKWRRHIILFVTLEYYTTILGVVVAVIVW